LTNEIICLTPVVTALSEITLNDTLCGNAAGNHVSVTIKRADNTWRKPMLTYANSAMPYCKKTPL